MQPVSNATESILRDIQSELKQLRLDKKQLLNRMKNLERKNSRFGSKGQEKGQKYGNENKEFDPNYDPNICYWCQGNGHWVRNCPMRIAGHPRVKREFTNQETRPSGQNGGSLNSPNQGQ
jgi:hypothetical protein